MAAQILKVNYYYEGTNLDFKLDKVDIRCKVACPNSGKIKPCHFPLNLNIKFCFELCSLKLILELEYQVTKQGAKLGRLINEKLVNAAVVLGTFMCCSDCKDQEIKK